MGDKINIKNESNYTNIFLEGNILVINILEYLGVGKERLKPPSVISNYIGPPLPWRKVSLL